jgi:hypothetical protein
MSTSMKVFLIGAALLWLAFFIWVDIVLKSNWTFTLLYGLMATLVICVAKEDSQISRSKEVRDELVQEG